MSRNSSADRNQGLDVLRVGAVALVFIGHFAGFLHHNFGAVFSKFIKPVVLFGPTGVDLFFVLSGYLIGRQIFCEVLKDKNISLVNFYLRRAFRILPNYWVVLLFYYFIPNISPAGLQVPLFRFIVLIQNFGYRGINFGRGFPESWSLCVEEHFYLLFPILTLVFSKFNHSKKTLTFIASLFVLGILLRSYLVSMCVDSHWIFHPTYTRLDGLLTGISLALVAVYRPLLWEKWQKNWPVFFLAASAILGFCLTHDPGRYFNFSKILGFPLVSIGFGFLLVAASSFSCPINRWRIPGVTLLARLTYAFYLTHKLTIFWIFSLFGVGQYEKHQVMFFLFTILISLGVAAILYLLVESPCLRLRDRLLQRPRARAVH